MILLLIFLLILIDIGLRISIVGIDLAFFVGGRVDSLRRKGETIAYYSIKKGKSKPTKAVLRSARFISRSVDRVARTGLGIVKKAGKFIAKIGIKIFQKCVSILWKLLLAVEAVVVVVDVIVFIIVIVASYFAIQSGMA